MTAAVGGWVAFSVWGLASLGETEQEKASKPWPEVICTSRITSLGPLGCHTMQGILDLFTPHLPSKATTTGGGRGRVKDEDHGSICRLRAQGGKLCLSFEQRRAASRLGSRFYMLPGEQVNNCFGQREMSAHLQAGRTHTEIADRTWLVDHINPIAAS